MAPPRLLMSISCTVEQIILCSPAVYAGSSCSAQSSLRAMHDGMQAAKHAFCCTFLFDRSPVSQVQTQAGVILSANPVQCAQRFLARCPPALCRQLRRAAPVLLSVRTLQENNDLVTLIVMRLLLCTVALRCSLCRALGLASLSQREGSLCTSACGGSATRALQQTRFCFVRCSFARQRLARLRMST
jgi:hypothetical protein